MIKRHFMLIVLFALLIAGLFIQSCKEEAINPDKEEIETPIPIQDNWDTQHKERGITILNSN